MSQERTLYSQILKATVLFGGVQLVTILLSAIRSKAISILIGPSGIGIAGLFLSVLNVIGGLTSLGLETSAVKYISSENADEDKTNLPKIISLTRKAVWVSGIVGAFLTASFSYYLSLITFGNSDYTFWFIWIAIALFFRQLTIGNIAILQGMQKLKELAKANLFGSFAGVLLSLPFYYFFKFDGIVPAIIISAFAILLFARFYSNKIQVEKVKITNRQLFVEGREMLNLGIMLSLSGLLSTLTLYIIQLYVSNTSSLSEVGFYSAGMMLLNSYVALIFSAMSTDFFPRLSAVATQNSEVRNVVLKQADVAILIIAPIIVLFIAFAPIVVNLLFSKEFSAIIPMVRIGIVGMLFRAVSWSMGYILLAKGDSKIFIRTAFGFNALYLALSVSGYFLFGLLGLGLAFTVHYFFHFVILLIITRNRYEFELSNSFLKTFLITLILCGTAFLSTFIEAELIRNSSFAMLSIVTIGYCLYNLNSKMDLQQLYMKFIKKIK